MKLTFGVTPAGYAGPIVCEECDSPFGRLFIASGTEGLCAVVFADGADEMLARLARRLPRACFAERGERECREDWENLEVRLAPAAPTDFQLRVWQALTAVPRGTTATYAQIARAIGRPTALRAVGAAIGANPFAILVPCHRIVPSQGGIGQYHWGSDRKIALLAAERQLR